MQENAHVTPLMDIGELASLWRVSPHTIRAWVKAKRLNPTRICRRLLFSPDECARFLAAHGPSETSPEAEV
jgi:DNA-binding transcriptional MerR regulator